MIFIDFDVIFIVFVLIFIDFHWFSLIFIGFSLIFIDFHLILIDFRIFFNFLEEVWNSAGKFFLMKKKNFFDAILGGRVTENAVLYANSAPKNFFWCKRKIFLDEKNWNWNFKGKFFFDVKEKFFLMRHSPTTTDYYGLLRTTTYSHVLLSIT